MVGTHRNLCDSLAQHCAESGNRTYVELRPASWMSRPCGIPDVLSMGRFAYGPTTWKLIAYEVKVSKSDFQRDVKAGKWMRYVSELGIQRVMFATPKGLVSPDDVPQEAGLIVYDEAKATWRVARTGRVLQNDIRKVDQNLLLAMLDNEPSDRKDAQRRQHKFREIAFALKGQIGDIPDEEMRSFASAVGHEFASRVSRKRNQEQEVIAIHRWAENLLSLLASVRGVTVEEVRAEAHSGYREPTIEVLKKAHVFAERIEEINHVAALLESLSDYRQSEDGWQLKNRREKAHPLIMREGAA